MGGMDQVGALAEFFVNILGQSRADAERNAAKAVMQDAYFEQLGITTPDLQLADLYQQDDAGINKFTEDSRLRDYQLKALEGLGDVVDAKGMTAEDAAAYNRARQMAGSIDNGLRGAAEHQAAARGTLGSTSGYVGSLMGAQAATNRAADMGLQAAADSRDRYMKALDSLGGQSGAVRGQDFGIASQRAAAQDAINRFNVGQKWQTQMYNLGVPQQNFENQMGLSDQRGRFAKGMADLYNGRADQSEKDAAKWGAYTKQFLGGMGSFGGGGGGGGFPF